MTATPRTALFSLSFGALLLFAGTAVAGPAQDTVQRMQAAAQRDDIDALDGHVDYDSIARQSLDEHYAEFTDDEKAAFLSNFRTIVRRAYAKGLSGKKQKDLRFAGESPADGGSVVHTLVKLKDGEPDLKIDYLMKCADQACTLADVHTDGSSLVESWRRMFRRIIKRHGKAELLSRIEKKAKAEK